MQGMQIQSLFWKDPTAVEQLTPAEVDLIYTGEPETLHMSAGFGVKLVMNRNFILSAEFAFPFNRAQDGKMGTNIGLNYIF